MAILTIEALEAQEGDCLLLHWGDATDPRLAVIDGGPGRVYEDSLRPRLEEILENRELDQLKIDLVMVSHVDLDHVVGIKKLFQGLKDEVENQETERPFKVKYLWHNTFNDVLGDGIDKYYKSLTASFTASAAGGAPNPKLVAELEKILASKMSPDAAEEAAFDVGKVLAGHNEGRALRDSHKFLFDKKQAQALNKPLGAGKTLITAEKTPKPVTIDGLKVQIVGPLDGEIKALQKAFDKFIDEEGLTAEAMLAAYADPSVTNLSSIVCLVGNDTKKILLTGDARGDFILKGLENAKLVKKGGKLEVDVLKVPHHGSDNNVESAFFERIIAKSYIFSGDGKHGNPERATLEMLIDARGPKAKYDIYLTYSVKDTDAGRKEDFEMKQKKKKPANREKWSAAKHSIASLLKKKTADGFQFRVIAGKKIQLELGDEKISW